MSDFGVALRVVHFAAAAALFGEFAFLLCVSPPASRPAAGELIALRRETARAAAWCLALAFASGLLWLAVEAAEMSGMPLRGALNRATLGTVLADTLFGRTWVVRFALGTALGLALLLARRETGDRRTALDIACGALAGGLLASLAWAGHAAAEQGVDRVVHLSADAVHLLAAGAWLGALPWLALALSRARRAANAPAIELAAGLTRRFSTMGVASVAALLLTGAVNAFYTVGSVPGLFGTGYGRLLLAKLVLFGTMVALAAFNRLRWMPRLPATGDRAGESALDALRRLRRNAIAESLLGLAVLGIVGALGVAVPAQHVQTLWPFPYTLDWDVGENPVGSAAALASALAAVALLALAARARSRPLATAGAVASLAAIAASAWQFGAPAYPSTYFRSPVRYAAGSIARGALLYAQYCVTCHGAYGHGDGPAAASLPVRPADLTAHLFHHREGDLYWWVAHGIAGTPMPGFGERIRGDRLWDMLNFLRAQADAEEAKTMNSSVEPWRPIVAPDFAFQIGRRSQETLLQRRGREIVLLVLYTPRHAEARLRALARAREEFRGHGVRVVAVPMGSAEVPRDGPDADMVADPDPDIASAYLLFRRTPAGVPRVPDHIEFLIDGQGYLRSRWMPGQTPDWGRIPDLLEQIQLLNREPPRPSAPEGHVH